MQKLTDTIKELIKMDDNELKNTIEWIDNSLVKIEQKKQFLFDIYNGNDVCVLYR